MTVFISFLITPIVEVLKLVYPPLAERICYITDIKNNSEILARTRDELSHRCRDLEREVKRGAERGKISTDEAINWLENARILKDGAPWLIKEVDQKGCFSMCFFRCYRTYKLGKMISKKTDMANQLLGKTINPITVDPLPDKVLPFPTATIKENTSAAAIMANILRYLRDDKTGKIGIWGKLGIGKSTILKNIYNNFEGTLEYHAIILVIFTKTGGLKRLLKDIATELSLDLPKKVNEVMISRLINKELKKKKFLLILDGLCEVANLTALGVPNPSEQNGCKIIIATEKREICQSMGVNVEIRMDPLPKEEAWELFCEKVGYIYPEIEKIAQLVCHECSGITAVLVSLGTALRNQQLFVWEKALEMLKSPESLADPENLGAAVLFEAFAESVSGEVSSVQMEEPPTKKLCHAIESRLADPENLGAAVLLETFAQSVSEEPSLAQVEEAPIKKETVMVPKFGEWNDDAFEEPRLYSPIFDKIRKRGARSLMERTKTDNQMYKLAIYNGYRKLPRRCMTDENN